MRKHSIKVVIISSYQFVCLVFLLILIGCSRNPEIRQDISLDSEWKTIANDTNQTFYDGFEHVGYDVGEWKTVHVPHNWDTYHGYLRKVHGNRHGYAWYRKQFSVSKVDQDRRYFLWFEGVGSYATIWLNGKEVGKHAGGRTTFTIDITEVVSSEHTNILAVRADHPPKIRDLPWVCGGCSEEWGFSEGSQPMGIFRPVHLIITSDIRIEPFGIHLWNDTTVSEDYARIYQSTEIKNYSMDFREIQLVNTLYDKRSKEVAQTSSYHKLNAEEILIIKSDPLEIEQPDLWSPDDPYLYTLETKILEGGKVTDLVNTCYGIRWISWPASRDDSSGTFQINGKPFFINGIGEYEHQLGGSHAFSDEQIHARARQIIAAGFNAFRDAHQPHNLRYQQYWDEMGILWWTQMSAHIWFDNPQFRENFKILLREWVKERRNNPSNIMWGLQNESTLPTEFAEECVQIIREMDPTASSQRLVTTCNGGNGTDWNVVQNWSGTYGGNPSKYDEELSKQLLNGEYGAWRSIDLHTEGSFNQGGVLSENRMTQLMEMKVRQAESVKNKVCGQFLWLLSSHDNPGRFQNGEGYREIDRIGPVNYKGLLTSWGEPTDAFYMYRANYVSAEKEPMVYIVSHTWPNRWSTPGIKDSITVYSNCQEVELFNDLNNASLGKIQNRGKGQSFVWRDATVQYNILQAIGYMDGKKVAEDVIVLHHLPVTPNFSFLKSTCEIITEKDNTYNYIYRVNCGGNDYTDIHGNTWMADRHLSSDSGWGSLSWTDDFEGTPDFFGSQRRTFDPIFGTNEWQLFQTFRYGREKLCFNFPVPDGKYRIELYFIEPWYGTGGGLNCQSWRLFDVAINDEKVLTDFDIWSEAGHDNALKKVFDVNVEGGILKVHFPEIASGQAIISAIAIASKDRTINPAPPSQSNIIDLKVNRGAVEKRFTIESWLDLGDFQYHNAASQFRKLPPILFGAEWIKTPAVISDTTLQLSFTIQKTSDIFIAIPSNLTEIPDWLAGYSKSPLSIRNDHKKQSLFHLYSNRIDAKTTIVLGSINTDLPEVTNYSIFVVPVSSLNASADQRPEKKYTAEQALLIGSGLMRNVENKSAFIELTDPTKNIILWQFNVGLASTYEMGINFNNPNEKVITALLELTSEDDIIIHSERIEFIPTGTRWQTVKTFTHSDINAGSYIFQLSFVKQQGIKIRNILVQ
jgi:beta-galactosidase